jgi:hypothetical protein
MKTIICCASVKLKFLMSLNIKRTLSGLVKKTYKCRIYDITVCCFTPGAAR